MRFTICALASLSLLGVSCAAQYEPDDSNATATTESALRGDPSQLTTFIDRSGVPYELYVTTCTPMPDVNNDLQMKACESNGTNFRNATVKIRDASGELVGKVHAEGPGGGCIHFQLPLAPVGGSLEIHAVVKGMPGAGHASTSFHLVVPL